MMSVLSASAQTDTIRYVKTTANGGKYDNDGLSWATAKSDLQDAINDLHAYLTRNANVSSGSIYVAGATDGSAVYKPSESTDAGQTSVLYTSFKIYDGIHVYGGFKGNETLTDDDRTAKRTLPDKRVLTDGKATGETTKMVYENTPQNNILPWNFKYKTTLSGNQSNAGQPTVTWDSKKEQWTMKFPGSSYHVVWFATNGFIDDEKHPMRADSLVVGASVDGFTIQDGNASITDTYNRHHNSYGGGVYMVRRARLERCVVTHCSATRGGGGVYMDGGGTMVNSRVTQCQSLGQGIIDGYGGGVCIGYDGTVEQSWIDHNVGRIGGGFAIYHSKSEYPESHLKVKAERNRPYAASCIISNNTATTEGGGVLMRGGTINHCTVVSNKCTGADITYGTIRYGRTGGVYVSYSGMSYNSVIWNNQCVANNNIQYAAVTNSNPDDLVEIYYTALNREDITDWTGTTKYGVHPLEDKNSAADNGNLPGSYPIFSSPTTVCGAADQGDDPLVWQPKALSDLTDKGVQINEEMTINKYIQHAHAAYDFIGYSFQPVSILGALRQPTLRVGVASVASLEPSDNGEKLTTIFVDPTRVATQAIIDAEANGTLGSSWDTPLQSISYAIDFIRRYKWTKDNSESDGQIKEKIQILVKQGTDKTAGPSSYWGHDLRTAAVRPLSNMRLFGSFDSTLKGTDTGKRNPHTTPTFLTANIIDYGYEHNSIHVIALDNVRNVVVDGFHLLYGNATKTADDKELSSLSYGGGILLSNYQALQSNGSVNSNARIDMTNNVVRNCVIANCSSSNLGGAVAVLGMFPKKDYSIAQAELKMVNCVIRNNTMVDANKQVQGVVTAVGNARVTMDHCTVVNNVGYPLQTVLAYGVSMTPTINISNSAIYANANAAQADRSTLTKDNVLLSDTRYGGTITGSNNLVDEVLAASSSLTSLGATAKLGYDISNDKTYAKFVNPTNNVGYQANKADNTLYGGTADYMPMDMNPMVNAAGTAADSYAYDLSASNSRDYGGLPDVGALEDSDLPKNGQVIYVRNTDGKDADGYGGAWGKAYKTISYALTTAKSGNDIWIAAGTYQEKAMVSMKEGVNVYGGFKAYGNPGKKDGERDISNLKNDYQTILDGSGNKRVVNQTADFNTATTWEGLTIQNGYLSTGSTTYGGAGIVVRGNMTLKNCLIRRNTIYVTSDGTIGGGGIWMQGGTVLDCIIRNNKLTFRGNNQGCAAGVRMEGGTLINSMIVENSTDKKGKSILGVGLYIAKKSEIYNSTIAYNVGWINYSGSGVKAVAPGVWDDALNKTQIDNQKNNDTFTGTSQFYNCIFWGNAGYGNTAENYVAINRSHYYNAIGKKGIMYNCYHSAPIAYYAVEGVNSSRNAVTDTTKVFVLKKNTNSISTSSADVSAYIQGCAAKKLFNEDKYPLKNGSNTVSVTSYDGSFDFVTDNPYSINPASDLAKSSVINMGAEEYGDVLTQTLHVTEDIAGAARIQDCIIDKGAYEYNGANEIVPTVTTETKSDGTTYQLATYYVAQNGEGVGNGQNPQNVACGTKFQKVLDAAGRYKYANPAHRVIVKLAVGFDSEGNILYKFQPSRTTLYEGNLTENPRLWSIQVPRGVELWGGYRQTEAGATDKTKDEYYGFKTRDVLRDSTILAGSTPEVSNVYHVVTFTDYVFDADGKPITKSDGTKELLSEKTGEMGDFSRAVLDGLYIEGGQANGTLPENQIGGAAVVPGWAHVRNCILQHNSADNAGGALYLQDGAVVSGSILQNNTANIGGAIAVKDYDDLSQVGESTYARVYSSTIVNNTGTSLGGGIYFRYNLRANSCVLWQNSGNSAQQVSGVTDTQKEQEENNYPFAFCAVQGLRLPGVSNINVSAANSEGTRFNTDNSVKGPSGNTHFNYYALQRASALCRTGMSYSLFSNLQKTVPSLIDHDIAGVSWAVQPAEATAADGTTKLVAKSNEYLEIGARALNESYEVQQGKIFTRLFVVHSDNINSDDAQKMQSCNDEIYKQTGSSMANPFLRLGDALHYVVTARQNYSEYANTRFEIFVAGGTYYPYHGIDYTQGAERNNTFLVPEMVTIIGGLNANATPDHYYGQETTADKTITFSDGTTFTVKAATTDAIRLGRAHYDMNKNSLIEPWEMQNQTILNGINETSQDKAVNVLHVITSVNNTSYVGPQPTMYSDAELKTETGDYEKENILSRGNRAIILDGLTIINGSAMDYSLYDDSEKRPNRYNYYKGGAILIDGISDYSKRTNAADVADRDIPLMLNNCQLKNNQAILGGGIFSNGSVEIFNSSIVQNHAFIPTDNTYDPQFATFSGGGALAINGRLLAVNTIFANNQADRGDKDITDPSSSTGFKKPANTTANGRTANEMRGFGGVIHANDHASIVTVNCDYVRNRAFAYPVVFNTRTNTSKDIYTTGVNDLFWGNQFDAKATVSALDKDLGDYSDYFNLGTGTDQKEAIFFSAYEAGNGLPARMGNATQDGKEIDPRELDPTKDVDDVNGISDLQTFVDKMVTHFTASDGTVYNNNIILNANNDAIDGPNFIAPSQQAGVDGYMQSADWLTYRMNSLSDNGWSYIEQDATTHEFVKDDNGNFKAAGLYVAIGGLMRIKYNMTVMPFGETNYMAYSSGGNMLRISKDPLTKATKDYIDIGVYEYQHDVIKLSQYGEIDKIWVAPQERTGYNSGESYDQPTSDVQRALEILLLSRNNHPKMLCMEAGEYSPVYEMDDNNVGFTIHIAPRTSDVSLKENVSTAQGYGISSLTIQGGYSSEIELTEPDPEANPVVLRMKQGSGSTAANTAHLLNIVRAEQWNTTQSGKDNTTTRSSLGAGYAVPITVDGLTFINNFASAGHTESGKAVTGGAAINYATQYKNDRINNTEQLTTKLLDAAKSVVETTDGTTTTTTVTAADKLTIKNCIFMNNGVSGAADVPAVKVEQGGGSTLIYDCLFHSNSGNPLEADDSTRVINCTFALNGGHVWLDAAGKTSHSEMHNSIVWRDNQATTNAATVSVEGLGATTTDGLTTIGTRFTHNAVSGITNTVEDAAHYYNVGLGDDNADVLSGPNFIDPLNSVVESRDFHINPAMRTINKADAALYAKTILGKSDATDATAKSCFYDADDNATVFDLAHKARFYDTGMERGAYECAVALQRIVYCNPNISSGRQNGTSWENAYGVGLLQRAVDAASIYSTINGGTSYVMVKGNNNKASEGEVLLRSGVQVIGSISPTYNTNAEKQADGSYAGGVPEAYVKQVLASRQGVATSSAVLTRVSGVRTLNTSYDYPALLDGVEVRADAASASSLISIGTEAKKTALRNCIIDGNTVTTEATPVADLKGGLLYDCLLYGNTVANNGPVVNLGDEAVMVNCTVVGSGSSLVNGTGKVYNSILYGDESKVVKANGAETILTASPFAPYFSPLADGGVDYTDVLPSYLTQNMPYRFQLHEASLALDAGSTTLAGFDATSYGKDIIDFANDCDLLGNPRTLNGNTIDAGCFETWRIADGTSVYATNKDGSFHYPHEGSVVYIGKGASLSLGSVSTDNGLFTDNHPFHPGYLLLQDGASLYGNGNVVRLGYLATEKAMTTADSYRLMAFPYRLSLKHVVSPTANASTGALSFANASAGIIAKEYDGARRSAWDYSFRTSDSPCWTLLSNDDAIAANDGWLLHSTTPANQTLRFTSWGDENGKFVYTEDGSPKTVVLTQYNQVKKDGSAHFTKLENMGWNLKGMPWLVSGYQTYQVSNGQTAMSAPHVFYGMNGEGAYEELSKGSVYTALSWEDGTTMSFGSAFFTQTAVIGDGSTEKVTFALPPLPSKTPDPAAKPFVALSDDSGFTDDVEVKADEDSKQLAFNIGSDGVKWQSFNDSVPQVYLLDNSSVALSLAGQAPVGVEMAMGYRTVKDGQLTVSLPDAEAFDGQSVWLKDKMTGAVTDLTLSSYTLQATPGFTDNRLTLQIGGVRPDGTRISKEEGDASWTVRVVEGRLQVNGIQTDDLVIIRTLSGAPVTRGRASSDTFVSQPLVHGVYVVTVNNRSKKVGL